jgi:hypothetical protein
VLERVGRASEGSSAEGTGARGEPAPAGQSFRGPFRIEGALVGRHGTIVVYGDARGGGMVALQGTLRAMSLPSVMTLIVDLSETSGVDLELLQEVIGHRRRPQVLVRLPAAAPNGGNDSTDL